MDDFLLKNPALLGMDQKKLDFIKAFAQKEKPRNINDAMPFLLANMNLAKKENINFSNSEVRLIAEILCCNLPDAEKEKINKIMSMLGR